jgi:Flp pilus assembly protein TadG
MLKAHRHDLMRPRLLRNCAGSSAVELAILLPIFLTFVLGIFEVSRALWTQSTLQYAVEAAARCYALAISSCNSASATKTYTTTQAAGLTISSSEVSVSTPSCGYKVSVSHTFDPIVPQLVPGLSITLSAQSCHP